MSRRQPMIYDVRVGQVWTISDLFARAPFAIRIDRVAPPSAHCTRLKRDGTESGRMEVRLRTLSRGLRRAKLVHEAPGTMPQIPPPEEPHKPERDRTASDFRKVRAPRGMPQRSEPTVTEIRIDAMRRAGTTYEVIAKTLGIPVDRVRQWHQNFRDIEAMKTERRAT